MPSPMPPRRVSGNTAAGAAWALLVAIGAFAGKAHGLETLTAGELAAICTSTPASGSANACNAYIRGFIDGAISTDPRVTLNVARELSGEESFGERAYRTRLGQRLDRFGPSYFAEFCIPAPVPLRAITDAVRLALETADPSEGSARDFVYDHLRANYPCDMAAANGGER